MSTHVRTMMASEARTFLRVHHAAVRGIAAADYSLEVIDAWAPTIKMAHIENVRRDRTGIKIVAEQDGEIVGIGEIAPSTAELRACYVSPFYARRGVGRALVRELESIARAHGLRSLWLDSSITAKEFYQNLGYIVASYGEHTLRTGVKMLCIKMIKDLNIKVRRASS